MTKDLFEQLEAYGVHANRVAPALVIDELEQEAIVPAVTPTRRPIPGWAIAVAAAFAVLVVVGGGVWILGGSESNVVDEPVYVTTTVPVVPAPPADPIPPVEPGTTTVFGLGDGLPSTHAWGVAATADGSVWTSVILGGSAAGTQRNCPWVMARFDGSSWTVLEMADDGTTPPPISEYCLTTPFRGASADGTLWFSAGWYGEETGLWSWRDDVWTTHDEVLPNPDAPLWIGNDGTVWLPAFGEVVGFPDGSWEVVDSDLARYANGAWETFDLASMNLADALDQAAVDGWEADWFLDELRCQSGGVDADGTLWVTGGATALASFDGTTWTVGDEPGEDWASWCISSVGPPAFGPDGSIWYASEGDVIRWHDGQRTAWSLVDTWTGDTPIRSFGYAQPLTVTPDGRVWVPSSGLVVFDPDTGSWDRLATDPALPHIDIDTSISVDGAGSIWIAGPSGIARHAPMPAETVSPTDGLPDLRLLDWEAAELPLDQIPAGLRSNLRSALAIDVFAMDDGSLLVTGFADAGTGTEIGLIWWSSDGVRWQPASMGPEAGQTWIDGVVTADDGYLARAVAGTNPGPDAEYHLEYWASTNGTTWEMVDSASFDGPASDFDALFDDQVKGWSFDWAMGTDLATVFGADAEPRSALVLGDRIVVVGTRGEGIDATVWIAEI